MRAMPEIGVLCVGMALVLALAVVGGPALAGQPELLRFEGQGLTLTVTGYDAKSGRIAGQVTAADQTLPYAARTVAAPDGTPYVTGQVQTAAGPVALTIVDETETVTRVTYAGKTYRVKRIKAADSKRATPAAPATPAKPTKPPAATAPAVLLKPHTLRDPYWKNMESHTVLVPEGWSVKGGAFHPAPKYFSIVPTQDITVTSPRGARVRVGPLLAAIDHRPAPKLVPFGAKRPAEYAPSGGRMVLYLPENVSQWAAFVKQKSRSLTRPGVSHVEVVGLGVIPELTAVLKKQFEPTRREIEQKNLLQSPLAGPARMFGDTRMLAAYVRYQQDGTRWEELRVFGVTTIGMDCESGRYVWWDICPSLTFRAPQGQLDAQLPLLRAISTSVQPTERWAQARVQQLAKLGRIAAQGAAARAAAWRLATDDTGDILYKGWRKREDIKDAGQRKVISAIYNTKNYRTADGRIAQLPNTHKKAFISKTGRILMTDNVNYNPNTDRKVNKFDWYAMEPVH